jgi:Arc/MetJ-type ribon-helix-helix transcriptional regulator
MPRKAKRVEGEEEKDWKSVSLPTPMIKAIDAMIQSGKYTYSSRGEFVKAAVREKLHELGFTL